MSSLTRREWMGLAALLIAAGLLRFTALRDLPPALWYDEAINGLDAWNFLREGYLPLFFDTGGHPREPLFIWLVGAMVAVAGPTPVSLRAVSAIIGVITIAAFWWMLRAAPRKEDTSAPIDSSLETHQQPNSSSRPGFLAESAAIPWLAAAALAALRWHVHFSRTSFRTIMTPLMIILVVGFLLRAMDRRRLREFGFAGAALGAGFYTYLAFRFAPVIAAIALLHPESRRRWRRGSAEWKFIGVMAAAALVVLTPLLAHYARHPEHFTGRTDQVTLFSEGLGPGLRQVGGNALVVFGMFSWPGRGDHVPKHNIPNAPVFGWAAAAFFYLGLGVAAWRARRRAMDAVMLVWLLAILQASIWSFGAPNLLRTVGATPAVAYFLAVGWLAAARWTWRSMPAAWGEAGRRRAAIALLSAMMVSFAAPQTFDYFHTWARDPRVPRDFSDSFFEAARFAREAADNGAYVLMHDELNDHPTVEFMLLRAPEVIKLKADNQEVLAAAWREGREPFEKPAPLFAVFTPTGSALEREFIAAFSPIDRRVLGPFPIYMTPPRPAAPAP